MPEAQIPPDLAAFRQVFLEADIPGDFFLEEDMSVKDNSTPVKWEEIPGQDLGSSNVELITADDRIDSLSFTIMHNATKYIERMQQGYRVRFNGGYKSNIANLKNPTTNITMFEGFVTSFDPIFPDNGKPELRIVASTDLFRLTRLRPGQISYPVGDPGSTPLKYTRDFHVGLTTISMKDIVRGILEEHGLEIGQLNILEDHNKLFDQQSPCVQQQDETDWDFICRLLMGRTKRVTSGKDTSSTTYKDNTNPLVCGYCRIFMEYDITLKKSLVHVVPEGLLFGDVSALSFRWHQEGSPLVPITEFDPTDPKGVLPINGVRISEDPNGARVADQTVSQDMSFNQDTGTKGAAIQAEPDTYVTTFDELGVIGELAAADATLTEIPSVAAKVAQDPGRFFTHKTIHHAPASAKLGVNKDDSLKSFTIKETLPPRKTKHGAKLRRFGTTLNFKCRGSIALMARKSYKVQIGRIVRYSGLWYCAKVVHNFGNIYTCSVEMAFDGLKHLGDGDIQKLVAITANAGKNPRFSDQIRP